MRWLSIYERKKQIQVSALIITNKRVSRVKKFENSCKTSNVPGKTLSTRWLQPTFYWLFYWLESFYWHGNKNLSKNHTEVALFYHKETQFLAGAQVQYNNNNDGRNLELGSPQHILKLIHAICIQHAKNWEGEKMISKLLFSWYSTHVIVVVGNGMYFARMCKLFYGLITIKSNA